VPVKKSIKYSAIFSLLLLSHIVAHAQNDWEYYLKKGTVQYREQMFGFALENLTRALTLNDTLTDAANMIGDIYARRHKIKKAIRYFNRSLEIKPEQDDIHVRIGALYDTIGKFDESRSHYRRAVDINRNNMGAQFNLIRSYVGAGDRTSARASFNACSALCREEGSRIMNLGIELEKAKKMDRALAAYHQSMEVCPTLADAYFAAAEAYRRTKKISKAAAIIDRLLSIDPENERALVYMAHLLFDNRDRAFRARHIRHTMKCLQAALAINPKSVASHLLLSDVYRFTGDSLKADQHERKAREHDEF